MMSGNALAVAILWGRSREGSVTVQAGSVHPCTIYNVWGRLLQSLRPSRDAAWRAFAGEAPLGQFQSLNRSIETQPPCRACQARAFPAPSGSRGAVLPCSVRHAKSRPKPNLPNGRLTGPMSRKWIEYLNCQSGFIPAHATADATRRHFLYAPGSNPGNKPAGRHAVQKARLLAVRSPSRLLGSPASEPNGSRIPPDRLSLPSGKACTASGSSNRVPERTPDRQR